MIFGSLERNTAPQQQAQLNRVITSLTFIPEYKGMDEEYLIARFGKPAKRQAVDETSV